MRRRFEFVLLSALLLVLCLVPTGCTIEPDINGIGTETGISRGTDTAVSESENISDNTKPGSDIKLVWYIPGNRQEPDISLVLDDVNNLLLDKINTTLDLQVFSAADEYIQKVTIALASKDAVDIVLSSKGRIDYHANSVAGNYKKLGIYMLKYPTLSNTLDNKYLDYFKVNGDLYGIPAIKTNSHNRGFLLRKDLVHKYGMNLDEITTLESIEPYLEIIRVNELQDIPLAVAGMDLSFGALDWDLICEEDVPGALYPNSWRTEIVNQFLAPESVEYYKLMRRWFINGYMHKDAASMESITELLKSRRYFAAMQQLTPGTDAEISENTGIEWVQVDITKPITTNKDIMDGVLSIPSGSKNPEKAFLFIEMLYTDPNLKNLLDHGIENVHYTKKEENNVISLTDPLNSGYKPNYSEKFGNMFLSFVLDWEDPLKHEKIQEYNNSSIALNSLGFAFDRTNMEPQITACRNVVKAYCDVLFTGSVDVDSTIKQFERELRAAGVDDLLFEMQYQYDTWRSLK